jgi:hypothetical protein
MSRKSKRIATIAVCAGIAAVLIVSAFCLMQSRDGDDGQQETQEETQPEQAEQIESDDSPKTAGWLEKADDDTKKLASTLCEYDWRAQSKKAKVSFSLDGTYTVMNDGTAEETGTWSLSDVSAGKTSSGASTLKSATGVFVTDTGSYSFVCALVTENENLGENMTVSQTVTTNAFASGSPLYAVDKEGSFTIWGIDNEALKNYIQDQDSLLKQMKEFCANNVPLATSCTWNKDVKTDYDKRTATMTFTCNNSKATVITAKILLDSGAISLSTGTSS